MTQQLDSLYDSGYSPLDGVEEVLNQRRWHYARTNRDELFLEMAGKHGTYRMMFMWNSFHEVMQFCCEYDFRVADFQYKQACETLNEINYSMWVGHFHLSPESMIPCYRFTQIFRGLDFDAGAEQMGDIIRIAVEECDFHYPALLMLSGEKTHDQEQLAFALMPTVGQS